jgi:exonuclease III
MSHEHHIRAFVAAFNVYDIVHDIRHELENVLVRSSVRAHVVEDDKRIRRVHYMANHLVWTALRGRGDEDVVVVFCEADIHDMGKFVMSPTVLKTCIEKPDDADDQHWIVIAVPSDFPMLAIHKMIVVLPACELQVIAPGVLMPVSVIPVRLTSDEPEHSELDRLFASDVLDEDEEEEEEEKNWRLYARRRYRQSALADDPYAHLTVVSANLFNGRSKKYPRFMENLLTNYNETLPDVICTQEDNDDGLIREFSQRYTQVAYANGRTGTEGCGIYVLQTALHLFEDIDGVHNNYVIDEGCTTTDRRAVFVRFVNGKCLFNVHLCGGFHDDKSLKYNDRTQVLKTIFKRHDVAILVGDFNSDVRSKGQLNTYEKKHGGPAFRRWGNTVWRYLYHKTTLRDSIKKSSTKHTTPHSSKVDYILFDSEFATAEEPEMTVNMIQRYVSDHNAVIRTLKLKFFLFTKNQ